MRIKTSPGPSDYNFTTFLNVNTKIIRIRRESPYLTVTVSLSSNKLSLIPGATFLM
jgi:hypothetical protein